MRSCGSYPVSSVTLREDGSPVRHEPGGCLPFPRTPRLPANQRRNGSLELLTLETKNDLFNKKQVYEPQPGAGLLTS